MVIEPFSTALVCGCRISCYAALDTTACAAFIKESRMECDNASQLSQEIRVRPKTRPAPTSSPTVREDFFIHITLMENNARAEERTDINV
jgi:hypothetical protein